jgi:hypothetical protein
MTLGDVEFQLRNGKMEGRKNSPDKFVPRLSIFRELMMSFKSKNHAK